MLDSPNPRHLLCALVLSLLAACQKTNGVERPEEIGAAVSAALQTADSDQIPRLFWSSDPKRLKGITAFGELLAELKTASAAGETRFGSGSATARLFKTVTGDFKNIITTKGTEDGDTAVVFSATGAAMELRRERGWRMNLDTGSGFDKAAGMAVAIEATLPKIRAVREQIVSGEIDDTAAVRSLTEAFKAAFP